MDRKLQQRLVGASVLAAFMLLIAPVLLDAEGRIPEKITNIPPQPKRPDLSHIRTIDSAEPELQPLPTADEIEFKIQANIEEVVKPSADSTQLWSVQVASFKDSTKASAFRDKLRAANIEVYVREKILSDNTLFTQVFVGPVATKAEAVKLKASIKSTFQEQGLVVRYRD